MSIACFHLHFMCAGKLKMRKTMNILIIEDEKVIAQAIQSALEAEAYKADIALRGDTGLEKALSGIYDLVILDVMLPGMDGFSILDRLSKEKDLKVIMLTARGELEDRLQGLQNGACDYLCKPFHMEELIARVNIQLKRSGKSNQDLLKAGNLGLNLRTMRLENLDNHDNVELSNKEEALMEFFMRHQGQVLSREQLYDHVWGWDNEIESNNLEAYISFLRKKLRLLESDASIKTVRGLGYRLESTDEGA